jgi:DNA relaxase NicK
MSTQKTTVDYLRFRTRAEPLEVLEAFKPMFGPAGSILKFHGLKHGSMGFQQAAQIMLGDMPVARLDYGGDSQRGWVRTEMTGKGCEWVQDWDAVTALEELPAAEVRRLDIALTTWGGQIDHETITDAHTRGRFKTGGRPPELKTITSTDDRAGRTCYVGSRTSDKFFRAYEKGYEMASKCGNNIEITAIDGHAVEQIYRCEVEFKAKESVIPWEAIDRRDQYFAGSYPFCADVLPGIEPDILNRRPERAPQMSLKAALANCRVQYGATLFTALTVYHGDIGAVWDSIVGDRHSQPLLEAGVLLVDHD